MRRTRQLILATMVLTLAGTAICGSAWGVTAKVIEVTLPPEVPVEIQRRSQRPR